MMCRCQKKILNNIRLNRTSTHDIKDDEKNVESDELLKDSSNKTFFPKGLHLQVASPGEPVNLIMWMYIFTSSTK